MKTAAWLNVKIIRHGNGYERQVGILSTVGKTHSGKLNINI